MSINWIQDFQPFGRLGTSLMTLPIALILGTIPTQAASEFSIAFSAPKSLSCSCNAKSWRYYDSQDNWAAGWTESDKSVLFGSVSGQNAGIQLITDNVFSDLDTEHPMVRAIIRKNGDVPEQSVEFRGTVVQRTKTAVHIVWKNIANKTWLAVVDLELKKAIVTHVYQSADGGALGTETQTLDCR